MFWQETDVWGKDKGCEELIQRMTDITIVIIMVIKTKLPSWIDSADALGSLWHCGDQSLHLSLAIKDGAVLFVLLLSFFETWLLNLTMQP